jgi:hypothetical protein
VSGGATQITIFKKIFGLKKDKMNENFKILPNEEFDNFKAYRSYKIGFEVLTSVLTKSSILWGYKTVWLRASPWFPA